MNDITISMTYYGQLEKLIYHCNFFSKLDGAIKDKITVQPAWEFSTDRDIDFKRTYKKR